MGGYFKEFERYKLEGLLDAKMPYPDIAKILDKSLKTIYNEVERGQITLLTSELSSVTKYQADVAQRHYDENKLNKGVSLKIGNDYDLVEFIEQKIGKEKWSPGATIGYIKSHKLKFKTTICEKTLYNYIYAGLFLGISKRDLIAPRKPPKKKYVLKRKFGKSCERTSIDVRPDCVADREEFGHWEMDTVVSGLNTNSHSCLLVLSERFSRQEKIIKLPDHTQKSVIDALDNLENSLGSQKFAKIFRTITMDNGTEFLNQKEIERSALSDHKRTTVFYCHPYSAFERGTNENINKMIRRFVPKGCDIAKFTHGQIARIERWINNYPRKIFGWFSSNEFLQQYLSVELCNLHSI